MSLCSIWRERYSATVNKSSIQCHPFLPQTKLSDMFVCSHDSIWFFSLYNQHTNTHFAIPKSHYRFNVDKVYRFMNKSVNQKPAYCKCTIAWLSTSTNALNNHIGMEDFRDRQKHVFKTENQIKYATFEWCICQQCLNLYSRFRWLFETMLLNFHMSQLLFFSFDMKNQAVHTSIIHTHLHTPRQGLLVHFSSVILISLKSNWFHLKSDESITLTEFRLIPSENWKMQIAEIFPIFFSASDYYVRHELQTGNKFRVKNLNARIKQQNVIK